MLVTELDKLVEGIVSLVRPLLMGVRRDSGPPARIYTDRIEISNPGEPLVPDERFIDGYQSRNERLADLLRRFGICEEKNSGIDRTVQAAEVHQLPAPDPSGAVGSRNDPHAQED